MVVLASGCTAAWGAASTGLFTSSAVTGVSTGAVVGLACAIVDSAKTLSPGALLVKATASSAIASSIFGIFVSGTIGAGSKTFNAAAISSIAGALTAAGTSTLAMSAVAAEILVGPVGSVLLGANGEANDLTYDCWKPVVRDTSPELSRGRSLREVAGSPMVKEVLLVHDSQSQVPQLFLHNVWDERFRIDFGFLPSGDLAAHAVRIS